MIYVQVNGKGRVQGVQNVPFGDLPAGASQVAVAGYDDVEVYAAYLRQHTGGDLFRAVIDAEGVFAGVTTQPTPLAERRANARAAMRETLRMEIETAPVCRALWEGADLEAIAEAHDWDAADIAAAERLMLRYALLAGDVPAPDWTLVSRYDE